MGADVVPPSGYSLAWSTARINAFNQFTVVMLLVRGEPSALWAVAVHDDANTTISAEGVTETGEDRLSIGSVNNTIDGQLYASLVLTDAAGNVGQPVFAPDIVKGA